MPETPVSVHSRSISAFVEGELKAGKRPNRLLGEKSPYLLQHAFNPVDWYPWGPEAFERARRERRVIFLSIGYSTCYWCHVMEREVFERPEIAALMNRLAVNVKVDREERPDVDRLYMAAVQAMTGGGGWPMSVFLTPDLKPFYGATYIPPAPAHGRPGFPDLLSRIAETWEKEPDRITDAGERLVEFIRSLGSPADAAGEPPDARAAAARTFGLLAGGFDRRHAGFGRGPKFPRPAALDFLLEYHRETGDAAAREMALATLRAMAGGGIHDHVGGGFHRYSVDGEWRVPHFEKMLYDQAQLACTYLSAFQLTGDTAFGATASSVLEYVGRELRGDHGGFWSAEDAESAVDPARPSEKREGAYYLWTTAEVLRLLGPDRAAMVARHFGLKDGGNALDDPHGLFGGLNIPWRAEDAAETAAAFGLSRERFDSVIAESLALLRRARETRPRPTLDDKVIAGWNGLAISAFARSARILARPGDLAIARAAADFVLRHLVDPATGALLRRHREGEARFGGGLQDYAFLIGGLLDIYEASFDPAILRRAVGMCRAMVERFRDAGGRGFFDTPGDDASLILRTKEDYDGAEPSGNSAAALVLWRLSLLTDDAQWRGLAEEAARSVLAKAAGRPDAAPLAVAALSRIGSGGTEIVVAGDAGAPDTAALLAVVNRSFLPGAVLMLADGGANQEELASRLPFLRGMTKIGGRAAAYVCRNYACERPVTDPDRLRSSLSAPG